ncbi:MAG: transposase [Candidatus Omnitrophica bacterium]|nr:transposase [Candidatus Omnitrophota bacterium]MBU1869552.1 transposase [Candidatus Omnitrophota bacterium]
MSRQARLVLNNASYHIVVRGNQKQKTFYAKEDYEKYLELIKHYKRKFHFQLYAYCLMPNHVHLAIEIMLGSDLSKIMKGLSQTYTILFNERYKKVGHLWQGRYKSKIILKDEYFLECLKYIELNPVRAKICKSPFDYPWSSYLERFGYSNSQLIDTPRLA